MKHLQFVGDTLAAVGRSGASGLSRYVRPGWLGVSVAIWLAFVTLTIAAVARHPFGADVVVARWIQSIHWGPSMIVTLIIRWLSGSPNTVLAVVIIGIVALVNWRATAFAIVTQVGAAGTYELVNGWLQLPRPSSNLVRVMEHPSGYGLPSGHADFALLQVALLLLCVAAVILPRRALWIFTGIGALIPLAVCIERVYVGAHWPSQTLAGMLVAAGWLTLTLAVRWIGDPVLARISQSPRALPKRNAA